MRTASLIVAALVAAAVLTSSHSASAQQPDAAAMEQAKKHFIDGQTKYKAGDKQGAVEEFKEAYKLSKNALLLYNIGFVYDEIHDKPLALHYYEKFLADAPDNDKTAPNRKLASDRIPALKKEIADDEAAANKGGAGTGDTGTGGTGGTGTGDTGTGGTGTGGTGTGGTGTGGTGTGGTGTGGGETPVKTGVTEFTHEVVEEAPPKLPLDITAKIPEDSEWKLTLYYRAAGEDAFHAVKMKPRYQEMVGRVPPTAMLGSSVQYYIEVKDKGGALVTMSGQASSPNIVDIDSGAKPHFYRDLSENGSANMAGDDDGDEPEPTPIKHGGGQHDTGKKRGKLFWAKWGTTAGAALLMTAAIVYFQTASNNSDALEADARNSQHDCGAPPCHTFSDTQRSYQSAGKFSETMTNVTLVLGAGTAVAAGVLWYYDIKAHRHKEAQPASAPAEEASTRRFIATPVVTEDFIGGAALMRF